MVHIQVHQDKDVFPSCTACCILTCVHILAVAMKETLATGELLVAAIGVVLSLSSRAVVASKLCVE